MGFFDNNSNKITPTEFIPTANKIIKKEKIKLKVVRIRFQ